MSSLVLVRAVRVSLDLRVNHLLNTLVPSQPVINGKPNYYKICLILKYFLAVR